MSVCIFVSFKLLFDDSLMWFLFLQEIRQSSDGKVTHRIVEGELFSIEI